MSSYTPETTAEEVAKDCQSRIANKTILITGASPSGLGAGFATVVAKFKPACIILATRDLTKAAETAAQVSAVEPSVRTRCIELDLGSLSQIRVAADTINSLDEHIDVIVNNAGVMASPYSKTIDGIESQFGINFVGHFLLTNLLLPKMLAGKLPIRVVNVSSNGHRFGPVRFEDWNFDDGKSYNRWISYAQSKTANMLFSVSLAQKLGAKNLVSVSLHPGVIFETHLSRDVAWADFEELGVLDRAQGHKRYWNQTLQPKTPSQGVATHVFAAFHPSLDSPDKLRPANLDGTELNGRYLEDCCPVAHERVLCYARDLIDAERLWTLGEELAGQKFAY